MEHPAAKVLCELADLQDQEVGDGTTSVVSQVKINLFCDIYTGCVRTTQPTFIQDSSGTEKI